MGVVVLANLSGKSVCATGGVQRLYIFFLKDNIFTSSTCRAALDYSNDVLSKLNPSFQVVHVKDYSSQNASADPDFYQKIVTDAIDVRADAILGCDFKVGAKKLRPTRWHGLAF